MRARRPLVQGVGCGAADILTSQDCAACARLPLGNWRLKNKERRVQLGSVGREEVGGRADGEQEDEQEEGVIVLRCARGNSSITLAPVLVSLCLPSSPPPSLILF